MLTGVVIFLIASQLTSAEPTYDDRNDVNHSTRALSGTDRILLEVLLTMSKLQTEVAGIKSALGKTAQQQDLADAQNKLTKIESAVNGQKTKRGCVCSNGAQLTSNLALNKPAFQGSAFGRNRWRASLANDGNRNTGMGQNSCSHTGMDTNPWWAVDLGYEVCVIGVTFVNRGDCCGNLASDFIVGLTNLSPVRHRPTIGNYKTFGQWRGAVGQGATVQMQNQQGTSGRYVIVQLPRKSYLHLCELEVYGCV